MCASGRCMKMIYVNKNRDISCEEWTQIVQELGLYDKLRNAREIVIKPNFAAGTYVDPKTHVMTDQDLLRSAIVFAHSVNPEAVISIAEADSTGYGYAFLKFEHLELPGSLQLPEETEKKVALLDLSRDRLQRVEDKKLIRYTNMDCQLWLSKRLLEADFVINLSNLKTHTVTGYTGACKNLFGCLPDFEKYHNHPFIHQTIHDLVVAIHPDLNVVDAFYGMERNGPVQGMDVDSGYRVFSDNPLEADSYAAATIGYRPEKVKYLRLLSRTLAVELTSDAKVIKKYKKASCFVRVMNSLGLGIQRFGLAVETFGHRIHTCPNVGNLCITIARPVLLRLFDYEQLKAWKRKIMK